VIDELRKRTGYNPRQRTGTALRVMLTVVEAFLLPFASCPEPSRRVSALFVADGA
jgi:hypothetical protein